MDDTAGPHRSTGSDSADRIFERWAEDRQRTATILHDDVIQTMSTALMALGLARMDQPDEPVLRDAETALATSAAALRQLIGSLGAPPDRRGAGDGDD